MRIILQSLAVLSSTLVGVSDAKTVLGAFPFSSLREERDLVSHDHHHHEKSLELNAKASILNIAENGTTVDETGRRCIEKMMMVEETVYKDVMTCDHKYKERCHESYVTVYEPHQEEECDERYRKVCDISYTQSATNEAVEECRTPLVQDCANIDEVEPECRTVHETVCTTSQEEHEVEDDIVKCETVHEKKCHTVTEGNTHN